MSCKYLIDIMCYWRLLLNLRCRNVRKADRKHNMDRYPFLNFPELYIMHNGFKAFFETHQVNNFFEFSVCNHCYLIYLNEIVFFLNIQFSDTLNILKIYTCMQKVACICNIKRALNFNTNFFPERMRTSGIHSDASQGSFWWFTSLPFKVQILEWRI